MTSVFFRHDSNIYNIIVFQTWHLHLWHQYLFLDIASTFISSVFSDMTSTSMTSVFFRHLHLWHQCFRHDIYIDDISVFHISNENYFIYRWMSKTTNPFHNRTATFLQLYKKWWQYHNWSFYPCELKQGALYVLLICYLPWIYLNNQTKI